MNNKCQTAEIIGRIPIETRREHNLVVDKIYKPHSSLKGAEADPISNIFGVANMGGFRKRVFKNGKEKEVRFVVLYTTWEDLYWHDEIDEELGIYIYYGDNKTAGSDLHNTSLKGNTFLKDVFEYAASDDFDVRLKIPPIFVFCKNKGREVQFKGLVVPGIKDKDPKDWLTAVWANRKEGGRFQNYKALFTILDTSSGSYHSNEASINLEWLTDIESGKAYESIYAPNAWKKYISCGKFKPLMCVKEKAYRSQIEQLPKTPTGKEMLNHLHNYFIDKDGGYSFEKFACEITKSMNSSILEITNTRPVRDGGFDGIGKYKIFDSLENSISVDFFLEAKCYKFSKGCGVKETSRLISRIKNRQFGILFTTSYLSQQAYEEITEDEQPVIVISGGDIVQHLMYKLDIANTVELEKWLTNNEY